MLQEVCVSAIEARTGHTLIHWRDKGIWYVQKHSDRGRNVWPGTGRTIEDACRNWLKRNGYGND